MFDRRTFITLLTISNILIPIAAHAQTTKPIERIVTIDPGHGGADWGATDGLKEKDAVLGIGQKVAEILRVHGVRTILTRSGDYFVGLDRRVEIARENKSEIFVSIHANYFDERPDASGIETYIAPGQDSRLATLIQDSIVRRLAAANRGIKSARFLVLRKSTIPAALVETGFISNKLECALLSTPEYRHQMADAIARGILQYLNIEYKLIPAKI